MARSFALVALLVALAAPARADDEKDWKWDPLSYPKPKAVVGDRWFGEGEEASKQVIEQTAGKAKPVKREEGRQTSYRFTGETLKVENDKAVENHFKIEKWSITAKGDTDKSLDGKSLVVTGTGADTKWECKEKDADLSEAAKAWIAKELAKKPKPGKSDKPEDDDDEKKLLFPEKAVGDGDEWTRDAAAIAKLILGQGIEIDAEKSSFKGKLTKVTVVDGCHVGHVEMKLILAIKPSKQWSEGGKLDLDFVVDGSLEEHKSQAAEEKLKLVLELASHRKAGDGSDATVKLVQTSEGNKKHGPTKSEEKKPEEKKPDEKKPEDEKKPDEKKPEDEKKDEKKEGDK